MKLIVNNTHRVIAHEYPDFPVGVRFVPHVPVPTPMGGWPRNGPARHVEIAEGRAMPLRGPRFRTSCRAVFHRLAGFAASIAIAALWSAVTIYAISLWVRS